MFSAKFVPGLGGGLSELRSLAAGPSDSDGPTVVGIAREVTASSRHPGLASLIGDPRVHERTDERPIGTIKRAPEDIGLQLMRGGAARVVVVVLRIVDFLVTFLLVR